MAWEYLLQNQLRYWFKTLAWPGNPQARVGEPPLQKDLILPTVLFLLLSDK